MSVYSSSHLVMSSAAATVTTARKKRHTSLTSECPFRLLTSYSSIPVPAILCATSVFSVCVVSGGRKRATTETQRTQRLHREAKQCSSQLISSFSKTAQDRSSTPAHDIPIRGPKGGNH